MKPKKRRTLTLRQRIRRHRRLHPGPGHPPRCPPPKPRGALDPDAPYVVAPIVPPGPKPSFRIETRYRTEAEARAACPPGHEVRRALIPTRYVIYYPSDADFPVIPDELTM